jgi:para-nitrobenzyl esterase
MSAYWANFARTGNPNGPGLPVWPAYQVADKKIMMLDLKPTAKTLPDAAALDFLYQQTANK